MSYKIKRTKKIPKEYWAKRELERTRKKYKGKRIPFWVASKVATKKFMGEEEQVHRKNAIVYYKEGIAKVKKVEKRGLWIEPFVKSTDKSIGYPSGKEIFVKEKEVEQHIYPITTKIPTYLSPPMQVFVED